jgi:hypothetical protein
MKCYDFCSFERCDDVTTIITVVVVVIIIIIIIIIIICAFRESKLKNMIGILTP